MPRFADSWFHPHDLGNYFSNIEYLRAHCHGDLILIAKLGSRCAMIMGTSLWPIMSKIQCWNLTTATLKPCYCHAGTLLLPQLEPCYCHAGTLLLTLLLPRWNLATATLQKNKLSIFKFPYFCIVYFCFLIFICLLFLLHLFSLFVFRSFHFYLLYWSFCFVFCFKYCFVLNNLFVILSMHISSLIYFC